MIDNIAIYIYNRYIFISDNKLLGPSEPVLLHYGALNADWVCIPIYIYIDKNYIRYIFIKDNKLLGPSEPVLLHYGALNANWVCIYIYISIYLIYIYIYNLS